MNVVDVFLWFANESFLAAEEAKEQRQREIFLQLDRYGPTLPTKLPRQTLMLPVSAHPSAQRDFGVRSASHRRHRAPFSDATRLRAFHGASSPSDSGHSTMSTCPQSAH
jgi:hypothetical protein